MSPQAQERGTNWNEMADTFDRWLPFIQPVAEALIDLADIRFGQQILDVASGTGEPSLSLARRHAEQGLQIIGVDGAETMVALAAKKAQEAGLSHLSFQHMQAEDLCFPDERFDRVISRFGVMLFDHPLEGVRQMRRVLKPEGKAAVAVWGEFQEISSLYLIWNLLMSEMPPEKRPPTPRIARMGPPGKLKALLQEAGFRKVEVQSLSLTYCFDDFDAYWSLSTDAGLLKEPLSFFSAAQRGAIRKKAELLCQAFWENERLVFQNKALLASALK